MNKLNSAYKSIGEVAKILGLIDEKNGRLNTHTIRFREKKFKHPKQIFFYLFLKIFYTCELTMIRISNLKKLENT